jgi:hypothetical protein
MTESRWHDLVGDAQAIDVLLGTDRRNNVPTTTTRAYRCSVASIPLNG